MSPQKNHKKYLKYVLTFFYEPITMDINSGLPHITKQKLVWKNIRGWEITSWEVRKCHLVLFWQLCIMIQFSVMFQTFKKQKKFHWVSNCHVLTFFLLLGLCARLQRILSLNLTFPPSICSCKSILFHFSRLKSILCLTSGSLFSRSLAMQSVLRLDQNDQLKTPIQPSRYTGGIWPLKRWNLSISPSNLRPLL